jgi:hypothetical protein
LRKWIDSLSPRCVLLLNLALAGGLLLNAKPVPAENPLYGPSGISPAAVKQGILGSCYFHASVAAVAKANPSAIRSAITGTRASGYRVHFTTGPEELVYAQDLEYAHAHNYDHSEGEWVAVLMRGYAQRELRGSLIDSVTRSTTIPTLMKPPTLAILRQGGPLLLAYDRAVRSVVNQDGQMDKAAFRVQLSRELSSLGVPAAQSAMIAGLIEHAGVYESLTKTVQANGEVFGAYRGMGQGGIAVNVISSLLGTARSGQMSDTGLLVDRLKHLHRGGEAMVAGTKSSTPPGANSSNWFVPDHAYTILDFNEGRSTVELRNPWAAKPAPDGYFELNLSTFEQTYLTFSYSD